jgi:hypothetical protein
VVGQVAFGFGVAHPGHGVAQHDPLVQCGEGAEFDAPAQGGLADQQAREWSVGVHVGAGSSSSWSMPRRWARSRTMTRTTVRLRSCSFGGKHLGGLWDQRGVVEPTDPPTYRRIGLGGSLGRDHLVAPFVGLLEQGAGRRSGRLSRTMKCIPVVECGPVTIS